ncbi:hypothetical protein ACH0C8_16440, partial [Acetobacter lovaniensis]|uniref:hypothetical protein n=1 Tax=Acetobacter lovaniensis TaxID=104100 RepID=UPI00376F47E2
MIKVELKKDIDPNSLRGIGSRPSGFDPGQVPIAGKNRDVILSTMGCEGFAIGGISATMPSWSVVAIPLS